VKQNQCTRNEKEDHRSGASFEAYLVFINDSPQSLLWSYTV